MIDGNYYGECGYFNHIYNYGMRLDNSMLLEMAFPRDVNLCLGGKLIVYLSSGLSWGNIACSRIEFYITGYNGGENASEITTITTVVKVYSSESDSTGTFMEANLRKIHSYTTSSNSSFKTPITKLYIIPTDGNSFNVTSSPVKINNIIWCGNSIISSPSSFLLPGVFLKKLLIRNPFFDIVSRIDALYLVSNSYDTAVNGGTVYMRKCEIIGADSIKGVDYSGYELDIKIRVFGLDGYSDDSTLLLNDAGDYAFYLVARLSPFEYNTAIQG